ncbi:MAG: RdgB/HAM1 family non-canonical purine NTP pyrophosphatase [Coriobacteriia bacterium]|nr:RdgB/HAM1 family non-canonical purine NTP pyrophosphatase [Coriobacteriia bacterium]
MKTVIIASNNAHKADEIRNALNFEGWEFKTLREAGLESDPEETGTTFVDNARIKAQAVHALCGSAVLADDSGLMVDALDGAPGVYSARYASVDGKDSSDAANNEKLLCELGSVADSERTARFVCSLVFIDEDGTETLAEGTVEGKIGRSRVGENGFGYDPLFMPDVFGGVKTMAQVTQDEKALVSHRGNALRALRKKLLGE